MSYTIATIETAILDNLDFAETGSVAKAKACAVACARWMVITAQSSSDQGASVSFDLKYVQGLRVEAQQYVRANSTDGTGDVRHLGVGRGYRGR